MLTLNNFADHARANGVLIDPNKIDYGRIQRWGTTTKPRSKNGWSVVYCSGDFINATYGDYQQGIESFKWHNREQGKLSRADQVQIYTNSLALRKQRELERSELLANVRTNYSKWVKPLTGSHAYIDKKGITDWLNMSISDPLGVTTWGGLVVPMRNLDNELMGYQTISPNSGTKQFATGTQKKGNFYTIAPAGISLGDCDRVFIAEGLATGVSAYIVWNEVLDSCNYAVLIAFDVGNISAVVDSVWSQYPDKPITLIADNDDAGTDKNVGLDTCNAIVSKHAGKHINLYAPGAINL